MPSAPIANPEIVALMADDEGGRSIRIRSFPVIPASPGSRVRASTANHREYTAHERDQQADQHDDVAADREQVTRAEIRGELAAHDSAERYPCAGASGFLLKSNVPAEMVQAIHVVAAGQALLSPSVTRRVVGLLGRQLGGPVPPRVAWDSLTGWEREMIAWVATGRSNDEIAGELVLSPDTVRTHVSRAMVKLGARDRAQLVVFAVREGLRFPDG